MNRPTLPRSPAASFVGVLAKLSLAIAGLSIVWFLFQLLLVAALGRFDLADWMQRQYLPVPPQLDWAMQHALAVTVLLLLLSLAFLAVSWALLRHRQWGRAGFIVFLIAVAAANFAMLPLINGMFDAAQSFLPSDFLASPEGRQALAQLHTTRTILFVSGLASAFAFAALHGWLVFKLCTPDVRNLFR